MGFFPEDLNDPFDTTQKLDSERLYRRILRRFAPKDVSWKPIRNLIGEQEFRDSLQAENPIEVITKKSISKITSVKGTEASSWASAVMSAVKKELRRLSSLVE